MENSPGGHCGLGGHGGHGGHCGPDGRCERCGQGKGIITAVPSAIDRSILGIGIT